MNIQNRVAKLRKQLAPCRQVGFRVAGKSRGEFMAEVVAMLLLQLGKLGPEYPRCFVRLASQPDWQTSLPEGTPIATQELLSTLAAAEGRFPGWRFIAGRKTIRFRMTVGSDRAVRIFRIFML